MEKSQADSKVSNESQMFSVKSSVSTSEQLNKKLSLGKIVCLDCDQNDKPYFKYSIGCIISKNKVLTLASALFSERTNKIHQQIYFIPHNFLSQEFNFESEYKIRISDYYINPKFFDEISQQQNDFSFYDVAICKLDQQDLQRLKFYQYPQNIGFNFDYKVKTQSPQELLICKYSELFHKNTKHILRVQESKITEKNINSKMIEYHFQNPEEQNICQIEGGLIFRKICRNEWVQYELLGIHKRRQEVKKTGQGFALRQFFEEQSLLSYQIKSDKQTDFNELMKHSFNNLLQIMLRNKLISQQKILKLQNQNQKLSQNNQRLNTKVLQLQNGGNVMNRQALNLKNKKITELQNQNNLLRQIEVELRSTIKAFQTKTSTLETNIKTLKTQIINLELFIEEEKQKTQRFFQQNTQEKQKYQDEKAQNKMIIQRLNEFIDLQKKQNMQDLNRVNQQLNRKMDQFNKVNEELSKSNQLRAQLDQKIRILNNENTSLLRTKGLLEKQSQQSITTIQQMLAEIQSLKDQIIDLK